MDILPLRDMVKDEYENYYFVIAKDKESVTLVNAFMEISFRQILCLENDIFREYDNQYMGKFITDILKTRINALQEKRMAGNIFNLDEVMENYTVKFTPLYNKVIV